MDSNRVAHIALHVLIVPGPSVVLEQGVEFYIANAARLIEITTELAGLAHSLVVVTERSGEGKFWCRLTLQVAFDVIILARESAERQKLDSSGIGESAVGLQRIPSLARRDGTAKVEGAGGEVGEESEITVYGKHGVYDRAVDKLLIARRYNPLPVARKLRLSKSELEVGGGI